MFYPMIYPLSKIFDAPLKKKQKVYYVYYETKNTKKTKL